MGFVAQTRHVTIAQIAPAVRVALGEAFGLEPGTLPQEIAALRRLEAISV